MLNVALPAGDAPQPATVTLVTLTSLVVYSRKLELSATPQVLPALPTLAPGTTTQRLTRN